MACFENIAIEDLDACINSEVQAEYQRWCVLWRSCANYHSPNAIEQMM
jgi:hypothetical protein